MMTQTNQLFEIKLHQVTSHEKPFVMTLHCSLSFELNTENAHKLVYTLLKGNELSVDDVSIYYYVSHTGLNDLYEIKFDSYLDRYIGNRVIIVPYETVSEPVQQIHFDMLKKIQTKID